MIEGPSQCAAPETDLVTCLSNESECVCVFASRFGRFFTQYPAISLKSPRNIHPTYSYRFATPPTPPRQPVVFFVLLCYVVFVFYCVDLLLCCFVVLLVCCVFVFVVLLFLNGPELYQMGPKWVLNGPQRGPKGSQMGPKWDPRRPSLTQNGLGRSWGALGNVLCTVLGALGAFWVPFWAPVGSRRGPKIQLFGTKSA